MRLSVGTKNSLGQLIAAQYWVPYCLKIVYKNSLSPSFHVHIPACSLSMDHQALDFLIVIHSYNLYLGRHSIRLIYTPPSGADMYILYSASLCSFLNYDTEYRSLKTFQSEQGNAYIQSLLSESISMQRSHPSICIQTFGRFRRRYRKCSRIII